MRTDTGRLGLVADRALAEVTETDMLLIPGGPKAEVKAGDEATLAWVRAMHASARWTASVCTGSLILATAGVLDGVRATTHWTRLDQLGALGAIPVKERVVFSDPIVSAAGVSAGIDMALQLARILFGDDVAQALQLGVEYDPAPPFDSGSPDKAPPHIVQMLLAMVAARD